MKRLLAFLLAALLVMPAASATEAAYDDASSDWARERIDKALELGIAHMSDVYDYRKPITRGSFARNAASLLAIEFGTELQLYTNVLSYRAWEETGGYDSISDLEIANQLGILLGREGGSLDAESHITRQEAAVMLARTYRAYGGEVPDTMQPLPFTDQGAIADWALEDVRLMNHLGVMNGIGNNLFDPLDGYTIEQCLVTLVRLHEKAPAGESIPENPFVMTEREAVIAKFWRPMEVLFAFETEEYYILVLSQWSGGMAPVTYHIYIVDQNFSYHDYRIPLVIAENAYYGRHDARPENAVISEDETKLIYTTTLTEDVYPTDREGKPEPLLHAKGLYTVTMDLKTGEQTWTRADLKEN